MKLGGSQERAKKDTGKRILKWEQRLDQPSTINEKDAASKLGIAEMSRAEKKKPKHKERAYSTAGRKATNMSGSERNTRTEVCESDILCMNQTTRQGPGDF